MRFEPSNWRPEHYVWYQTNGNHEAYVQVISDEYRCRVHLKTGECFYEFTEPTLSQAKKRALLFLGEEEFVKKNYQHVRCTNEQ